MNHFYTGHLVLVHQTAIFAVVAMSVQIVMRTGVFSFASIGFFGIGAYASANFAKGGVPVALDVLIVVACTGFLAYLLSFPLMRLRGLYLGMVTFAFAQILSVVAINGGSLTGGAIGIFGVPQQLDTLELFAIAGVCALMLSQLERRALGRSLELLRVDERLAVTLGNNVSHQRSVVFAISGALGALAGVMNTLTSGTITPNSFGFELIVAGLTMAVVGGVSSWLGAWIGAVIVVWFPDVFSFVGRFSSLVYGLLIVVVVVLEPSGILGVVRRLVRFIRRGFSARPDDAAPLAAAAAGHDAQRTAP